MRQEFIGAYLFGGRLPLNLQLLFKDHIAISTNFEPVFHYIPFATYGSMTLDEFLLGQKLKIQAGLNDLGSDLIDGTKVEVISYGHVLDKLLDGLKMVAVGDILMGNLMGLRSILLNADLLELFTSADKTPIDSRLLDNELLGKKKVHDAIIQFDELLGHFTVHMFAGLLLDSFILAARALNQVMFHGLSVDNILTGNLVTQRLGLTINDRMELGARQPIVHDAIRMSDEMTLVIRPTIFIAELLNASFEQGYRSIYHENGYINTDLILANPLNGKVWDAYMAELMFLGVIPAHRIGAEITNMPFGIKKVKETVLATKMLVGDKIGSIFNRRKGVIDDLKNFVLTTIVRDLNAMVLEQSDLKFANRIFLSPESFVFDVNDIHLGTRIFINPESTIMDLGWVYADRKAYYDAMLTLQDFAYGSKVDHLGLMMPDKEIFGVKNNVMKQWYLFDGFWLSDKTIINKFGLIHDEISLSTKKAKDMMIVVNELFGTKNPYGAFVDLAAIYGIKVPKPAMIQILELFGIKWKHPGLLEYPHILSSTKVDYVWYPAEGTPIDPLIVPGDNGEYILTDSEGFPTRPIDDATIILDPVVYPLGGEWLVDNLNHGLGGPADKLIINTNAQYLSKISPNHFLSMLSFMIVVWDHKMFDFGGYDAQQGISFMLQTMKTWIEKYNNDNMYWRIYRFFKWLANSVIYNPYCKAVLKRTFTNYQKNEWRPDHESTHFQYWTGVCGHQLDAWRYPWTIDMDSGGAKLYATTNTRYAMNDNYNHGDLVAGDKISMTLKIKVLKPMSLFKCQAKLNIGTSIGSKLEILVNGIAIWSKSVQQDWIDVKDQQSEYIPLTYGDHIIEFRYTLGDNWTIPNDYAGIDFVIVENTTFVEAWTEVVCEVGSGNLAVEKWIKLLAKYYQDHYVGKEKGKRMIWINSVGGGSNESDE